MSRQRSANPEPTDARAARVPTVKPDALGTLWRVCQHGHSSPWWFSCRTDREHEAGRFDLQAPRGTCYWADDAMSALFERLTDPDDLDSLTPASALAPLCVWDQSPPPPSDAADTTALKGGLPKEFGAGTDYRPCWAWADKLDEHHRNALVAWSRMAPNATRTVAVFGPRGAGGTAGGETSQPAMRWFRDLVDAGLVAEDPTLDQLDLVDD